MQLYACSGGTLSVARPSKKDKVSMDREEYIWVHDGKLRPGMLVLNIHGNARDGYVPEGFGVVEEITNIDPATPSGGKEYVRLYLEEVKRGTERTRLACKTKLFEARV